MVRADLLLGLALIAALFVAVTAARAELVIDVRRGNFQPIPIAVADFVGDPGLGPQVAAIVTNNLRRSGYFVPVEKTRFPEQPSFDAAPRFDAWKAAGVQGLVTGRVTRDPSGRLKTEFRLWDVFAGQQVTGQQYFTDPNNWRRVGHIISDAVYTKITGVGPFFDTRVVYVDESGPKENRRKRLAIMDQDGGNVRYLTQGDNLVVTPRYSPTSQDIAFMSQASGQQPRVQVINLETGARQIVGNFPDMTSSPRFSPDGQRIVMSLQQGGNANIYMMDLGSRTTTRITSTGAIDTSPSFSPDGSQIVFELRPRRPAADLPHGRGRLEPAPHLLRPGLLFAADLVAARRLHRLHQAHLRRFRHRHHEAGRLGRAHPDGRLPQRGPDLGAERPVHHVLPRSRRPVGRAALHGRHHRARRAARADSGLRLRPDLVAAPDGIPGQLSFEPERDAIGLRAWVSNS